MVIPGQNGFRCTGEITWREDFVAARPGSGWLLEWFLRRFVQRCADGLTRHAASLAADAAGR